MFIHYGPLGSSGLGPFSNITDDVEEVWKARLGTPLCHAALECGGKEVLVCADQGYKRQVSTHGSPGPRAPERKLEVH